MSSKLKITQIRSRIGCQKNQRETLLGLGLKKINQTVIVSNTPQARGMLKVVQHLVLWEEVHHV